MQDQLRLVSGQFAKLAKDHPWRITSAAIILLLSAATVLLLPKLAKGIVDAAMRGQGAINDFAQLGAMIVVWAVVSGARTYILGWLGERAVTNLQKELFRDLLDQPQRFRDEESLGGLLSVLSGDSRAMHTFVTALLSTGLRNALQLFGALLMLALISTKLFAFCLMLLAALLLPLLVMGGRLRGVSMKVQREHAALMGFAEEVLRLTAVVQLFGMRQHENTLFGQASTRAFDAAATRQLAGAILTSVITAGIFLATLAVLWLGGVAVAQGRMTAGALTEFVFYAVIAAAAAAALVGVVSELAKANGAIEHATTILSDSSSIDISHVPAVCHIWDMTIEAAIRFDAVSFYPPSSPTPILSEITFSVSGGERLAIVGNSGSGKSTILRLLLGLEQPTSGDIRIAGRSSNDIPPSERHCLFSHVPQDCALFTRTVADNICYGRIGASPAQIVDAARAADADAFIGELSGEYESEVGGRGVLLSGGQRQRIALARALLHGAPILVLDEISSALDAKSEDTIRQHLLTLPNSTVILVTHRAALARDADKVLVVDAGRCVQFGAPSQLSEIPGPYQKWLQDQGLGS